MRWNLRKTEPAAKAKRACQAFLWFPKLIDAEIRWLERTQWIDIYFPATYYPTGELWSRGAWYPQQWITTQEFDDWT